MEHMKQCPQCGKAVTSDRTYCMNCGVTLGIRCPACRIVLPVGTKTCTSCGHAFVKKKKKFNPPIWNWMKKHAKPLAGSLCLLLLTAILVAAAFSSVRLSVLLEELTILEHGATGYDLMGYFLGGHPSSVEGLLELPDLRDSVPLMKTLLFLEGLGWLVMLVSLMMGILLFAANYKRFGRITARRLFAPLGAGLGGAALTFGMTPVMAGVLFDGMVKFTEQTEEAYLVQCFAVTPLLLLIAFALVMAVYGLLYVSVFRKLSAEEESRELALGYILVLPVKALLRLTHRLSKRIAKKKGKTVVERDEPAFTVTHRFSTYVVILIIALVFTQALLSKVSNIFFWFVFLLPLVMLVYVLWAKTALSVSMLSDSVTTEKNTPYTYEFRVDNHSPLAIPFVDAKMSIPQSNAVRCTERTVRLSMAPLTGYHMKNTVSFRFRGTYDIGVRCFYVYDFFRIFRVRIDVENLTTVYVLPRRLSLDEASAHAISDNTVRTVSSPLAVDRLEVSDIRDYRTGDSLKAIHWKLSSKSENFIVKDYNTGTSNQTVVFCDLAPHFPDEAASKKPGGEAAETLTPAERRAKRKKQRKEEKKKRKEQAEQAANRSRKNSRRIKETADTHAISDEALQERLQQRATVAEALGAGKKEAEQNLDPAAEIPETIDVHELAANAYYEDMNEYLADGVVELTIATVLAELRQGHEVTLLWFDRRSDTGVFVYALRGVDEFENIYHLFATAPLCAPACKVTSLTAMINDIQSAKQMFVLAAMDAPMLTDLGAMPGVSDAGSFGSAEVVLYNPSERFRYPRDRELYLEACREQLAAGGLALTVANVLAPQPEGGSQHEAT